MANRSPGAATAKEELEAPVRNEAEATRHPAALATTAGAAEQLKYLFPSRGSFDWHFRQHKKYYVAGGAVLLVNGRLLFDVHKFESLAVAMGQRDALTHFGITSTHE